MTPGTARGGDAMVMGVGWSGEVEKEEGQEDDEDEEDEDEEEDKEDEDRDDDGAGDGAGDDDEGGGLTQRHGETRWQRRHDGGTTAACGSALATAWAVTLAARRTTEAEPAA